MRNKYIAAGICLVLFGCDATAVSAEDNTSGELLERVTRQYENENYMGSREKAELFIVRFPNHPEVDAVRIMLLDSCIQTGKFKAATTYATRYLEGSLLQEKSRESVEYYLIQSKFANNQQWMGRKLQAAFGDKINDKYVLRNQQGLEQLVVDVEQFLDRFPNSNHIDEFNELHARLRDNLADHELSIAHFYMQKGNFEGARQRLERYESSYIDIEHPLYDYLVSFPELS